MTATYRFGNAELQPALGRLRVDGADAALGSRAFDLLVALVERRGRLVTKAELLDLVWPHLVVEENNLQVQVANLRRLIGARAITTVPGRGYRFDTDVTVIEGPGGTSVTPAHEDTRTARVGDALASAARPGVVAPPLRQVLVGRDDDLAALEALWRDRALLTISGPGGVGKTRVAQALAAREGAAWVDLAVVTDPALVGHAFAHALGVTLMAHDDPLDAICTALRGRSIRLVVDNAEHLVDAVARALQRLREAVPELRALVTSQQPLHIADEQVYRLGALALPEPDTRRAEQALDSPAVALFCARAAAVDPRFRLDDAHVPAIVQVCRRLDGLPLALELAAARLPLLGADALLRHLDARLELLVRGNRDAPARQQTLRATLEWSHGLLAADEQVTFRRLGVLVGGASLSIAQRVAGEGDRDWQVVDRLGTLVDRSLVQADGDPEPRLSLMESAREFALERLRATGELDAACARHAAAMRALADTAYEDFWVLADAELVVRYTPELDNWRAALVWSREHEPETYVGITGSLMPLLRHLSLIGEALGYLQVAHSRVHAGMASGVRARLALGHAMLDNDDAASGEAAVELNRAAGDTRGTMLSLYYLCVASGTSLERVRTVVTGARALLDPAWPPKLHEIHARIVEELMSREGRHRDLVQLLERRAAACAARGHVDMETTALMSRVVALYASGDVDGAITLGHAVCQRCASLHIHFRLAWMQAHTFTAMLTRPQPDLDAARELARSFAALDATLGWRRAPDAVDGFALLAALEGRLDDALTLCAHADALYEEKRAQRDPISAAARALVATLVGRLPRASGRQAHHADAVLSIADAARLALWPTADEARTAGS
jgi:predicted ATPase/DNA-binding winged helix-turn-helix (wHTH) protein